MSTMENKVRAMLNDNGRTQEEAETFRRKAEEREKHGLQWIWAELKAKQAARDKAREDAEKATKKSTKKGVKDDGRLRVVKIVASVDERGRKKWAAYRYVSHADLKAFVKGLREAGYEVKTAVVK